MIFITKMMKQASGKPSLFWRRAMLFIVLLLSVCASHSAALRLLPLPPSGPFDVKPFPRVSGACASRTPSPNREPNANLKIVAGSQYRARDRHAPMQLATHAPEASSRLQPSNRAATTEIYAGVIFKTPPLSIHTGRAPPRFG